MTFTEGPEMLSKRWYCSAVRVDSRRVLVFGVEHAANSHRSSFDTTEFKTELLDLETMSFTEGTTLPGRGECIAAQLDDERAMVLGGQGKTDILASWWNPGDDGDVDEAAGTDETEESEEPPQTDDGEHDDLVDLDEEDEDDSDHENDDEEWVVETTDSL